MLRSYSSFNIFTILVFGMFQLLLLFCILLECFLNENIDETCDRNWHSTAWPFQTEKDAKDVLFAGACESGSRLIVHWVLCICQVLWLQAWRKRSNIDSDCFVTSNRLCWWGHSKRLTSWSNTWKGQISRDDTVTRSMTFTQLFEGYNIETHPEGKWGRHVQGKPAVLAASSSTIR